jgi:hypothetical protein
MIGWTPLKREAVAFRREIGSMSVVLFMTLSLASVAIASRNAVANDLWVSLAAWLLSVLLVFLFRRRIERLGPFAYAGVLMLILTMAFLFGT